MSKVLVDRELLDMVRNFTFLHDDGCAGALRGNIDKALAARPAETEGVVIKKFEFEIGEGGPVTEPLVRYKDHLAALSAVTAERDRLESMLIRTATRHFALQIKDRADDKKLDECLSEGIAMLEAERDRLRDQVKALQSDANSWQSGYDKGRHDGTKHRHSEVALLRAEAEALRVALLGIASVNPAERGIEWAKAYASDGLSGTGSELYIRWLETFKEAEALRSLLSKSLPVVEAHAGASHMLEGFRPTRNQWDELVDEVRAAMAAKEE